MFPSTSYSFLFQVKAVAHVKTGTFVVSDHPVTPSWSCFFGMLLVRRTYLTRTTILPFSKLCVLQPSMCVCFRFEGVQSASTCHTYTFPSSCCFFSNDFQRVLRVIRETRAATFFFVCNLAQEWTVHHWRVGRLAPRSGWAAHSVRPVALCSNSSSGCKECPEASRNMAPSLDAFAQDFYPCGSWSHSSKAGCTRQIQA